MILTEDELYNFSDVRYVINGVYAIDSANPLRP